MGVMVNKNQNEDNELSRQITADLRARQVAEGEAATPDFADDAAYLEGTKKTGKFAWVWVILIVLAIAAVVAIVMI